MSVASRSGLWHSEVKAPFAYLLSLVLLDAHSLVTRGRWRGSANRNPTVEMAVRQEHDDKSNRHMTGSHQPKDCGYKIMDQV